MAMLQVGHHIVLLLTPLLRWCVSPESDGCVVQCEHYCTDSTCTCADGFTLDANNRSCSLDEPSYLIICLQAGIQIIGSDGNSTAYPGMGSIIAKRPSDVVVDMYSQELYWTNGTLHK